MIPISINDTVPSGLRTGDEYDKALNTLQEFRASADAVVRSATHEAGHLLCLQKLGLVASDLSDVEFRGPTIYNLKGKIRYFFAAVDAPSVRLSSNLLYTTKLLRQIAKVGVAGGVVERELLGPDKDWSGDAGDEALLHEHCYKAMAQDGIPFEAFSMWREAQRRVSKFAHKHRDNLEILMGLTRPVILEKCFGLSTNFHFTSK
jgi:hypothetical protein